MIASVVYNGNEAQLFEIADTEPLQAIKLLEDNQHLRNENARLSRINTELVTLTKEQRDLLDAMEQKLLEFQQAEQPEPEYERMNTPIQTEARRIEMEAAGWMLVWVDMIEPREECWRRRK